MSMLLGLDIGSTRTKAIIRDARDGIVARASAPTPVLRGEPDRRDHDAVWRTLSDLVAELPPALRAQVSGVAVASVGEEVVLLRPDGSSGGPTPCWYTLAPRRASGAAHTAILSWQLFDDLRADEPAALTSAASFTDLGSWVTMRIAGLPASDAFLDLSHASRTGLLSVGGEWDAAAVAACGADLVTALPRLVESGARIGTVSPAVARAWGLPADVRVHAGGHDHFCGALAAGIDRPGDVFVSVGTSESVVQLIDRGRLAEIPDPGEHGFFVRGGLGYLHRSQPSGRDIAALLQAHGSPSIDDLYAEIADSDRAPSAAAAAFDAELRRQARDSAQLIRALTSTSGRDARRIVIGGVPADSPHWRAVRAEALAGHAEFVREPELAGMGAALLAAAPEEDAR
ncbi:FGGY family carbohydrate kinase [Microbacterium sp. 179-I 3D3 NHS]|uniref:FGGY family carbohydrate kinase n=1 Tax=Microbacterium sp. 179-I 3D3 NHS TaxID=3142382 RepID=UPI0039A2DF0C